MSGKIIDNVTRSSGTIAPTTGGLNWDSDVITASTVTVESNRGYWINTTSNACTVTLPSSASIGDQIILVDYARNFATNNLIIDSNGNNFQGSPDTYTVDYTTNAQSISIVFSDSTKGWIPISDDAVTNAPVEPGIKKGIFAYGNSGSAVSISNLVSNTGVVASDVTGVGTVRYDLAAAGYGADKAIFGYGYAGSHTSNFSMTNLVSNSGVVASDTSGVGTDRRGLAAARYGTDKAIFAYGYGNSSNIVSISNLVNSSGVVASDVTGVGTVRYNLGAAGYGEDKAIFAYGQGASGVVSLSNLVNSSGVVAADVTGVGTARFDLAATNYGASKAIFGYGDSGSYVSITNLVTNLGVVGSDVTGVGTARFGLAAAGYSLT